MNVCTRTFGKYNALKHAPTSGFPSSYVKLGIVYPCINVTNVIKYVNITLVD